MTHRSSLLITLRYLFGAARRPAADAADDGQEVTGQAAAGPRRRGRVRGAVIGIAVSLVPLIVVLEVADGMIQGITARFIEVGTYHIEAIAVSGTEAPEVEHLAKEIAAIPGVTGAYPERQGLGLVSVGTNRTGATIRAIDPAIYDRDPTFRKYIHIEAGSFNLSTPDSIVVGTDIARRLGLKPGDRIRIITVRTFGQGGFLPKVSTFTVRGVFTTGYQELDKMWVFIPFLRGVQILPSESSRQLIGIKLTDPYALSNPLFRPTSETEAKRVPVIVARMQDILGPEWQLYSWYELQRAQYMSFATTKNLLVFIMILIVAVASVNISSSMIMLVMEKQSEIAILKSLGASPAGIRRVFLLAGFGAGTAGTLLGIAAGLFLAVNINEAVAALQWVINALISIASLVASPFTQMPYVRVDIFNPEFYLQVIPIRIRVSEVLLAAFLSILLSTAASYLPARRAGNIRPLEIMRKH